MAEQEQLLTFAGIPRPTRSDSRIKEGVIQRMIPRISEWMARGGNQCDPNGIRKDLLKVLGADNDGYQLAKRLEAHCHWECDSSLVEILSTVGHEAMAAYDDLVKQWVKDTGPEPKLKEGTACKIKIRGETVDGTVTGIHPVTARYTVCVPAHGQTRRKQSGRSDGYVLDFEIVEKGV